MSRDIGDERRAAPWPGAAFRAASVTQQGLTEAFYQHVGDHPSSWDDSEQEQLAIEYAERFALDHVHIDNAFFARVRSVFTDAEIFDLTICMAHVLPLGRLLRVLGIDETGQVDV